MIDALTEYKTFLEKDLLPRSKGDFALGADTLAKKFAADEMVTLPLDRLLAVAQADLARNQKAFAEVAAKIAPGKSPAAVAEMLAADHPKPEALLQTTQQMLDSMREFLERKQLVTIPSRIPARVEETPPFLRATTSASMDTPGPFETVATEAFYNMTLPDPKWPKPEIESFMKQWYYASIANVSVHEVWPGHYLQFLYGPQFPSKVRKVYGAASNAEGWAHYSEQMMLDEGFHADDPRVPHRPAPGRAPSQRALHRRHPDAQSGVERGRRAEALRARGLPAGAGRAVGSEARHDRSHLRLLHDGEADDPEAPRRLSGQSRDRPSLCAISTTGSSSSGRSRCRSCARRCSAKSASRFLQRPDNP